LGLEPYENMKRTLVCDSSNNAKGSFSLQSGKISFLPDLLGAGDW